MHVSKHPSPIGRMKRSVQLDDNEWVHKYMYLFSVDVVDEEGEGLGPALVARPGTGHLAFAVEFDGAPDGVFRSTRHTVRRVSVPIHQRHQQHPLSYKTTT